MKSKKDMVAEFHGAFGLPLTTTDFKDKEQILFRQKMTVDELNREGYEAIARDDPEAFLDSMVDALYFIYGTAVELGWDIDEAFDRVHEANMKKLDENGQPRYRDDGKILKPDGWKAPDLSDLVPHVCTHPECGRPE